MTYLDLNNVDHNNSYTDNIKNDDNDTDDSTNNDDVKVMMRLRSC